MKSNKGFSLIFVIITTSFVGILIAILMHLSLVNIRMKELNRKSERNFYSTESALDQYTKDWEEYASNMLAKAYQETLEDYGNIMTNGGVDKDLANQIAALYVSYLAAGDAANPGVVPNAATVFESSPKEYFPNHKDDIGACFKDTYSQSCSIATDAAVTANITKHRTMYESKMISYGDKVELRLNLSERETKGSQYERAFVLKNVIVKETEADGTETIIHADIKIKVPELSFAKSAIYPEYTRYALIADKKLEVKGNNTVIDGYLYSGTGGVDINAPGFELTGNCERFINRGDLRFFSGASAVINAKNVWVENVITEKENPSSTADVTVNANNTNFHVSNDLILNAPNSKVNIKGNYFGFSHNEQNDTGDVDISDYSSAILVNGKNTSLSMDLSEAYLAGHAYVSAKGADGDSVSNGAIMLGQSMGVKSDQIAYMIPSEYLTGKRNPVTILAGEVDKTDSEFALDATHISDPAKLEEIKSLVKDSAPVVKRYYKIGSIVLCYLYYNFKDEKCATTYYENNWLGTAAGSKQLAANASKGNYIGDGVKVDASTYLLAGSVASVNKAPGSGALSLSTSAFPYEKYETLSPSGNTMKPSDDSNRTMALQLARTQLRQYMNYQLRLMESASIINPDGGNRFISKDNETYRMFRQVMEGASAANDMFKADGEKATFEVPEETSGAYEGSGSGSYVSDTNIGTGEYARIIKVKIDADSNPATPDEDSYVYLFYNPVNEVRLQEFINNYSRKPQGIVVSYGDLNLNGVTEFKGMIICGGTANVPAGSSNVKLTADEIRVQKTFEKIQEIGDKYDILKYFAGFTASAGGVTKDSKLNVGDGFSYENWQKNAE